MKTQAAVQHGVVDNLDHLTEDNREICFDSGKTLHLPGRGPSGAHHHGMAERRDGHKRPRDGHNSSAVARRSDGEADRAAGVPALAAETEDNRMPKLTIVIGANGAGKSTWCDRNRKERLPTDFYNADSIAKGLGDWNSPRKQQGAFPISRSRAHTHRRHGHPLQTVPSAGLIERPQEKNRVDALR